MNRLSALLILFLLLNLILVPASGHTALAQSPQSENPETETSGEAPSGIGKLPGYPIPDQPIPYHRPGRAAKTGLQNVERLSAAGVDGPNQLRTLDQMLADGTMTDPLQGNYRLTNAQQIILGWTDTSTNAFNQSVYRSMPVSTTASIGDLYQSPNVPDLFDTASGDLNNDGIDESVTLGAFGNELRLTIGDLNGSFRKLTSSPAVVHGTNGRIYLYVRGFDDQIWSRVYSGTEWGEWVSLGGPFQSAPAAGFYTAGNLDRTNLVAVDMDGNLRSGGTFGTWSPVTALPEGLTLTSDPTLISWNGVRRDAFVRGSDNNLWHIPFDGNAGGWGDWVNLGGVLTSAPSAVGTASGQIHVFARGYDNGLWQKTYDGAQWGDWQALDAPPNLELVAAPAASAHNGQIDVVVATSDPGSLYGRTYVETWSAWQTRAQWVTNTGTRSPGITHAENGDLEIFQLSSAGDIRKSDRGRMEPIRPNTNPPTCCQQSTIATDRLDSPILPALVATGHFLGAGPELIAVYYKKNQGSDIVRLYSVADGFTPQLYREYELPTFPSRVDDLAVGDFDGDGVEELFISALEHFNFIDFNANSGQSTSASATAQSIPNTSRRPAIESVDSIHVAAGELVVNRDSAGDEIADDEIVESRVIHDSSLNNFHVLNRVVKATLNAQGNIDSFEFGPATDFTPPNVAQKSMTGAYGLAVGDLNGDRVDEIVGALDAIGGPSNDKIKVFTVVSGTLSETVEISPNFVPPLAIDVGDLDNDLKDEIVLVTQPANAQTVRVYGLSGSNLPLLDEFTTPGGERFTNQEG